MFYTGYLEILFHSFVWGWRRQQLPWLSVGNRERSTCIRRSSPQTQTPLMVLVNRCFASAEEEVPDGCHFVRNRCRMFQLPGRVAREGESPRFTSWSVLKNDKRICLGSMAVIFEQISFTVCRTSRSPLQNQKSRSGKKITIGCQEFNNSL